MDRWSSGGKVTSKLASACPDEKRPGWGCWVDGPSASVTLACLDSSRTQAGRIWRWDSRSGRTGQSPVSQSKAMLPFRLSRWLGLVFLVIAVALGAADEA